MYPMFQIGFLNYINVYRKQFHSYFCIYTKKANILINSENTLIFTEHQEYAKCITTVILGIIIFFCMLVFL